MSIALVKRNGKFTLAAAPQTEGAGKFPSPQGDLPELDELKARIADQDRRLEEVCSEIESMQAVGPMAGHRIACAVAKAHGLSFREMISRRRDRALVHARQQAMWEMRYNTPLSMPQIGKVLGGLDHTTVLHGVRRHQERLNKLKGGSTADAQQ